MDQNTLPPDEFVDSVLAFAALMSFQDYLLSRVDLQADSPEATLFKLFATKFRSLGGTLDAGLRTYGVPMADEVRRKTRFQVGLTGRMVVIPDFKQISEVAEKRMDAIEDLFPVVFRRFDVAESIIADARALSSFKKITRAIMVSDPVGRLSELARVPATSSAGSSFVQLIDRACKYAGVEVPTLDVSIREASQATALGDDLRKVDVQLQATDPGDATSAELAEKRSDIVGKINDLTANAVAPEAVKAAVATSVVSSEGYATAIGKQERLSSAQEQGVLATGKVLLAAGAGSGKTKVMASKVVYFIKEMGVPPQSIIATSFSRKSAKELTERVKKYGGENILQGKENGFGTSHSVAAKIVNKYAKDIGLGNVVQLQGGDQTKLVRLAMEQVKMAGAAGQNPNPDDDLLAIGGKREYNPGETTRDLGEYAKDLQVSIQRLQDKLDENPGDFRLKFTLSTLNRILSEGRTQDMLSQQEKMLLQQAFAESGVTQRVASVQRQAAFEGKAVTLGAEANRFYKESARKWFNLGIDKEHFVDIDGRPIGARRIQTFISKNKGGLKAPGAVAAGPIRDYQKALEMKLDEKEIAGAREAAIFAACYGAYEWLKKNAISGDFMEGSDFDDILINCCRVLMHSDAARSNIQKHIKVLIVDEGQDSNPCQVLMYGLIAGTHNKDGTKKEDKTMTASTFALVGDEKQCPSVDTPILTPNGEVRAGDLKTGDMVLSYRNGSVVPQVVKVTPSDWTHGIRVCTAGGRTLLMSPNHKIWASPPTVSEGEVALYLMYRHDLGFRVGITNKGRKGARCQETFSSRANQEGAERMWILAVCKDREEALLEESRLSLRYGIPTSVFRGENRGINQDRLNLLFKEFGLNGGKILQDRHMSFDLPHWMTAAYGKYNFSRKVVHMKAHASKNSGSMVTLEWTPKEGDVLPEEFGSLATSAKNDGRLRIRKASTNYRESLDFALRLAKAVGASVERKISLPEGQLMLMTASSLYTGMEVPVVADGNKVVLDKITSITTEGGSFVGLEVDDASNFFGGGILSHNSIYAFRGAEPELFINSSDANGGDFKTLYLTDNYRSGSAIVEAANAVASHLSKTIPMVCKAHPSRGEGSIHCDIVKDNQEGASMFADTIAKMCKGELASEKFSDFGLGVRTNAEAMAYGVELLKRAIPFKSKLNFFNTPTAKAMIDWMNLGTLDSSNIPAMNEAVLRAHRSPNFYLDQAFTQALESQARNQNYYEWMLKGGWQKLYSGKQEWRKKFVKSYVDAITAVRNQLRGSTDAETFIQFILDLPGGEMKGQTSTMLSSLIEEVKGSPEAMDMLVQESEGGRVTEEQIEVFALAPIQPLLSIAKDKTDIRGCVQYVQKLKQVNDTKSHDDEEDVDAVIIDTVHGWKGLECKHMYIPMSQGTFPHARSLSSPAEEDSERRLAYVALTRGRESVTVIAPRVNLFGKQVEPSQFVYEGCIPIRGGEDKSSLGAEKEVMKLESQRSASVLVTSEDLKAIAENDADYLETRLAEIEMSSTWGGL